MRLFQKDHVFSHPWVTTTAAFWRKYPNSAAEHVREVDVFDRTVDPTTGVLTVKRLIVCESNIPGWMTTLGFPSVGYAIETTEVDPFRQTMVIRSSNITGSAFMTVEERCTYAVAKENSAWTHYSQTAEITSFAPFISSQLESWSFDNMVAKMPLGVQRIEALCERVRSRGIASLVPMKLLKDLNLKTPVEDITRPLTELPKKLVKELQPMHQPLLELASTLKRELPQHKDLLHQEVDGVHAKLAEKVHGIEKVLPALLLSSDLSSLHNHLVPALTTTVGVSPSTFVSATEKSSPALTATAAVFDASRGTWWCQNLLSGRGLNK